MKSKEEIEGLMPYFYRNLEGARSHYNKILDKGYNTRLGPKLQVAGIPVFPNDADHLHPPMSLDVGHPTKDSSISTLLLLIKLHLRTTDPYHVHYRLY